MEEEARGSGALSDGHVASPHHPLCANWGLEGLMPIAFREPLSHGPVFPRFRKGADSAGFCFLSVLSEIRQQM